MIKKVIIGILGCLSLVFQSCNSEDIALTQASENGRNETNASVLTFASKADIRTLVEEGNANSRLLTRVVSSKAGFISLLDTISSSSPIFSQFTLDEQASLIKEPTTYYDALGYEGIIPNKNFARLLNYQGEIQLKDSVYRVTQYGMLVANRLYRGELDAAHERILTDSSIVARLNTQAVVPVSNNVYLSRISTENVIEQVQNGSGAQTRTSVSELPVWSFPRYSSGSHTFVGWLVGKVLGDRSVKHHDFMSNRRVKGSLYDYDYLVYQECGCFVAMSRKRGGFLRKLNGWKSMKADELYINYKNVILELDLKLPNIFDFPKAPRVVSVDKEPVPILSQKDKETTVTIFSYEMTIEQVKKIAGEALQGGISQLKNYVDVQQGVSSENNIRVAKIITRDKIYIILRDFGESRYFEDSFRSVMGHAWKLYISSNIIKNPLSLGAAKDLYSGLQSIPVKRIAYAEVLLAGRLGSTWGGMIIEKK